MNPALCWVPLGLPPCPCGAPCLYVTQIDILAPDRAIYHFADREPVEQQGPATAQSLLLILRNHASLVANEVEPRIKIFSEL